MKQEIVLIFGGTGNYGKPIVKHLVSQNVRVRVLSRNAQRAKKVLGSEVEIVEGDATCRDTIINSLKDVTRVVVCLSAISKELIRRMRQIERDAVLMIMEEARNANIQRLVYLSGYEMRAEVLEKLNVHKVGEIKLEIEEEIKKSKFNWTIFGCPPAYSIFFAFLQKNKMVVLGGGIRSIPTISQEDVGVIVAQATLGDDLGGRRFRLTGPEAISFPEAVKRFSLFTGREIKFIKIPLSMINVISFVMQSFFPFFRFIYLSLKLLNYFPTDLSDSVPEDHRILLDEFSYTPVTFDMEIERRMALEKSQKPIRVI